MARLSNLICCLGREPFCIPPSVACRMSLSQIAALLTDPRDLPLDDDGDEPPTRRELHRRWAMYNRVPDWLEEELWTKRGAL